MKVHRLLMITAIASLAYAGPATAQTKFIAISGGATYGDLCCGVNTSSRWGGTAGLTAGMRNWDHVVFNLEGNWVQKGGGDTRLDYIEVPFLVGGSYGTGTGLRTRAYTGIGIAFPISCSAPTPSTCDRKKSPEWAWPIGIQFGKWTPSGAFFALDVRYSIGLSDAFDTVFASNRSWQFRLFVGKQLG